MVTVSVLKIAQLALAAFVLCASMSLHGHAISTNYLFVEDRGSETIQAVWDVAAADLHWALGLDADHDGRVLWSEVLGQHAAIAQLTTRHLSVRRGGADCRVRLQELLLTQHAGELHLALQLIAYCPRAGSLEIASTLLADQDASQKTLLDVTTPSGHFSSLISAQQRWRAPRHPSWLATLGEFIGQGMWHVWIGYDHIAFLLLLLLPSVLQRSPQGWRAVPCPRRAAQDVLIIVTAFTVTHSITLGLAATGLVRVPTRFIEAAIAFSIVAAGVMNLFPQAARWRFALASGFGLVHGFGFANALAELDAQGSRLVPALAGFNLGVELAQLSIVLLVFPWLLWTRTAPFYATRFMPATSVVIAIAGVVWLAQRVS